MSGVSCVCVCLRVCACVRCICECAYMCIHTFILCMLFVNICVHVSVYLCFMHVYMHVRLCTCEQFYRVTILSLNRVVAKNRILENRKLREGSTDPKPLSGIQQPVYTGISLILDSGPGSLTPLRGAIVSQFF